MFDISLSASIKGAGPFLCLFVKGYATVAAGDGDLSLPPGDPELLSAVGTPEIAVLLVTVDGALELKPADDRSGQGEKLGVFRPAAGIVPGGDPEKDCRDTQEIEHIEEGEIHKQVQHIEDQGHNGEEEVELIPAIPAIKEPLYEVHGRRLLLQRYSYIFIIAGVCVLVKKSNVNKM